MSLIELLHTTDVSPQRNKIYGVVVGIVRDIKDPQGLGRIKVDFPWLAEQAEAVTMSSGEGRAHSYWARIATLMAGKGRGSYFIPEVGDEVLVAFEHGDLDRPYIIGALWNADDPPPESMDSEGQNHVRSITSRSGHRIVLDDSDDQPSILIVDKTGENSIFIDSANNAMEIKVAGDLTVDVTGNMSITVQGKLSVEATQDIAAQTQANLDLKATGNGTLESGGPLDIKSSAKLTADGTGQAEVKAATVTVNGSAMAEVKGALVKIN
jgi:phage baseplate assembly protein V